MTTDSPVPAPTPSPKTGAWIAVAAITAAALAVRAFRLSYPGFSGDEYATTMFGMEPVSRILSREYEVENNPPLYYLLQHLWLVFGDGRGAMRTLPLLFGVLAVPLTFILGRLVLGTREGVVACALVASAQFHIQFSREIRAYSMLTAAALGALIGVAMILSARGVLRPEGSTEAPAPAGKRSAWGWALYVGCSTVAVYTHSTAVLLPMLATGLVFALVLARRAPRDLFWRTLAASALVAALNLPWLLITLQQIRGSLLENWLPSTSLRWVRTQMMATYPFYSWFKPVLYLLPLAGAWLLRKRPVPLAFVLTFVAGTPLLLFLVSLYKPVFYARPLLWPTVFGFLLMAAALVRLESRGGRRTVVLATLVVVAAQGVTWPPFYPSTPDSPDAAAFVEPLRGFDRQRDAVLLAPVQFGFEFWYETRELNLPRRGFSVAYADYAEPQAAWFGLTLVRREALPACVGPLERLWMVRELQPRFPPEPGGGFETLVERLAGWGKRKSAWTSGNLELVLWERLPR